MVVFGLVFVLNLVCVICNDLVVVCGQGYWFDDKIWVYDFESDLLLGVCCVVVFNDMLCLVVGNVVSGLCCFMFQMGGLFLVLVCFGFCEIEECQVFVMKLNGLVELCLVFVNIWCEVVGIGNCILVMVVDDDMCNVLFDYFGLKKEVVCVLMLLCLQVLLVSVKMQFVYGKGVVSLSGIVNEIEWCFDFIVCVLFVVSFLCECENVKVFCMLLCLFMLLFNVLVVCKQVEVIKLCGFDGLLLLIFVVDDYSEEVMIVMFNLLLFV